VYEHIGSARQPVQQRLAIRVFEIDRQRPPPAGQDIGAGIESRRWMVDLLAFYRAHMPGFADAWIMQTASQIGVRHSRRLTGVTPVVREAWQAGVQHADEIGVSPSLSPAFASVSVPYASLVPVELDGLLAPGRHMASDASSHTFMREIPQCWLTGQAAGVAAALSAGSGTAPRALGRE